MIKTSIYLDEALIDDLDDLVLRAKKMTGNRTINRTRLLALGGALVVKLSDRELTKFLSK